MNSSRSVGNLGELHIIYWCPNIKIRHAGSAPASIREK